MQYALLQYSNTIASSINIALQMYLCKFAILRMEASIGAGQRHPHKLLLSVFGADWLFRGEYVACQDD